MYFKTLLTKTLLVAAGLCVGANAWGDFSKSDLIADGWSKTTVLSQDAENADYVGNFYYAVFDKSNELMIGLADGVNNSNKALFYKTPVNPISDFTKVWILEVNNNDMAYWASEGGGTIFASSDAAQGYQLRNFDYQKLSLQTEFNEIHFCHTHDQTGVSDWGKLLLAYNSTDDYWTIENRWGTLKDGSNTRYIGQWANNGTFADGEECAGNRLSTDAGMGKFELYRIGRNEFKTKHSAYQASLARASHSTDFSKLILDNTVTNTDNWWGTLSDGSSLPYTGAPDNYYVYGNNGLNSNQWVYGVPAGRYTISVYTYNSDGETGAARNLYAGKGDWNDFWTTKPSTNAAEWTRLTSTAFELTEATDIYVGYYASSAGSGYVSGFDNWKLTLTAEQVMVGTAGYATYVNSDYALDFSGTDIKAYKVKVSTKGVATLTQVNQVPAGTPVLLYYEGGKTEFVPILASAAAVSDNDLVAGTGAAVATTSGEYTNMILNNIESKIGFYFANGQTVAANRAYLHIATTLAPDAVGGAPMFIVFDGDSETTGISASLNDKSEMINDNAIYNLNGQRVAQPTKGLYVVNGKKVIVK